MIDILNKICNTNNCKILPKGPLPKIEAYKIPSDLKEFFELCGGVELFVDESYSYSVGIVSNFLRANPVIFGDTFLEEYKNDISNDWFIIAKDLDGQPISIDLNEAYSGRCYDSFFGRHAAEGDCPIIAFSFSELLEKMFQNKGQYPYWLNPDFDLGDAYSDRLT